MSNVGVALQDEDQQYGNLDEVSAIEECYANAW